MQLKGVVSRKLSLHVLRMIAVVNRPPLFWPTLPSCNFPIPFFPILSQTSTCALQCSKSPARHRSPESRRDLATSYRETHVDHRGSAVPSPLDLVYNMASVCEVWAERLSSVSFVAHTNAFVDFGPCTNQRALTLREPVRRSVEKAERSGCRRRRRRLQPSIY